MEQAGQATSAGEPTQETNNDRFDDLIDKICGADSPWSYEEAVHIASDMWDDQAYGTPLPTDYVPSARRRHMTGGA